MGMGMGMGMGMNSLSGPMGSTTMSINSIELLNKMLETKGDSGLMIHGDLDTNQDGNAIRPRYWSEEEDEKLRQAVEQYGAKHWKTIATFVPGRTQVQCLQRWNKVLKPGLKKGAWTEEEDSTLQRLVNKLESEVNWSEVAYRIPGRSAKQCRERWSFNLDPQIDKSDWSPEEDEVLLAAQVKLGNKWSQIALQLPGRTENAIKTRFKSILRARRREWHPVEDALLLKYHEEIGNKWEQIAGKLPNRTKHAVKTRFKFLTEDKLGDAEPRGGDGEDDEDEDEDEDVDQLQQQQQERKQTQGELDEQHGAERKASPRRGAERAAPYFAASAYGPLGCHSTSRRRRGRAGSGAGRGRGPGHRTGRR
jgi:myb proto-oncogene protein